MLAMRNSNATVILLLCFISKYIQGETTDVTVNTKVGLIRGLRATNGDYSMFLGIPYGQVNKTTPFGHSTPYPPFDDVFEAYNDTSICPQKEPYNNTITGNLDCLHLNIYVPVSASAGNRLPILVWIYGGVFQFGFAGRVMWGPKYLVKHNIIIITINYRVGPYGFMCLDTPEAPGNQGLKDQFLALKWIKNNIEEFGGDSDKITIAGSSSGAMTVDLHIVSEAEKLFDRAILHSGNSLCPTFREPYRTAPLTISKYFGFHTDNIKQALSYLATLDPISVITAVHALSINKLFFPCVENRYDNVKSYISRNWIRADLPKAKNMTILMGFAKQEVPEEYSLETESNLNNIIDDNITSVFDTARDGFKGMRELIWQYYKSEETSNKERNWQSMNLYSDLNFIYPTIRNLEKLIKNGADKIYLYMFSYSGGRNYAKKKFNLSLSGATHADELGYLFDLSFMDEPSPDDQAIIDLMTTAWANFVKHGDPTPETSQVLPVKWLPVTATSPRYYLDIDTQPTLGTSPYRARMAFWDNIYKTYDRLNIQYPDSLRFTNANVSNA